MTTQVESNPTPKLESSWLALLLDQFSQPYFQALKQHLLQERKQGKIHYPPGPRIFAALDLCPVQDVRVVILGQDPYHNEGQAHGLCFSVPKGTVIPPSLVNIYKEMETDLGIPSAAHGNLESWAQQGVLLLNTSLTVRAHEAASHSRIGWSSFTDTIIERIAKQRNNLVFMLWGSHAIRKKELIPADRGHLVLEAPHPSPLSAYRGFFGCQHFSKANGYLQSKGLAPINWQLPQ